MVTKLSAIITAILLITSIGTGKPRLINHYPSPSRENIKHCEKATEIGVDESEPVRFEFSLDGYQYIVTKNGMGKRTKGTSDVHSFRLALVGGDNVERVFYAEHESNLLLLCEVGNYESGEGFITSLDQRTLRAKWRRKIPSFNIGRGLIEGDHAYLTALGFIAKFDLNRGVYVWQHSNMFRWGDFDSFELPRLTGDTVLFKEETVYPPTKTVKVNKLTGRILSISK